ncbi:MAG: two-component sensor histidine kinase [Flavobacteriaceae bacterium]|nr:MAG: two-component sensor histidine kinase [Flavobacteriaceae bacterium]
MKLRKTYFFAFWSSLYITTLATFVLLLLYYISVSHVIIYQFFASFYAVLFLFSFLIIQYRVERFIYLRVKKIYEDVSLFDVSDMYQTTVTSDMESLSRQVQEFAENKRHQIEVLKERECYRRDFLGNVSHELKTPLFTVQGFILTLLDGAIDDETIREKYLQRANKGVERLIAIVKDLDMISKLESADLHLNMQPINMVVLVQGVFDLLEMKAKKKDITLSFDAIYDAPVMILGDAERLEQVLINLLVNSIKYGNIGGTTLVSLKDINNKKLSISVSDNGEGIDKEFHERLFERFYRVDQSRSRAQGGSGLGLSIVKHIIEAHGEEITVKSELHKGSEFTFTLKRQDIV